VRGREREREDGFHLERKEREGEEEEIREGGNGTEGRKAGRKVGRKEGKVGRRKEGR
jgi:hypothetical protein